MMQISGNVFKRRILFSVAASLLGVAFALPLVWFIFARSTPAPNSDSQFPKRSLSRTS
jgi:hypothetical protein